MDNLPNRVEKVGYNKSMKTFVNILKELLRLAIFAIPAALIQILTNDPTLTGTYGAGILFILRAVDKTIHDNKNNDKNGILPF